MKNWQQILKEAEKLTRQEFHRIPDQEIRIKMLGGWWWFCDDNKEKFSNLINSELNSKTGFLTIK